MGQIGPNPLTYQAILARMGGGGGSCRTDIREIRHCPNLEGPMFLISILASCAVYRPDALYASNRPVTEYEAAETVEVKRCTSTLFGVFPLGRGYGMRDLVTDAKAQSGSDVLVEISIDSSFSFWLLGFTECTRLSAYATDIATGSRHSAGREPGFASSSAGDAGRARTKASEAAQKAASSEVSRSALSAPAMVYEALERDPPTSQEQLVADAKAVAAAAASGMDISEILEAANTGAKELGPNASIEAIIKAGSE